MYSSNDNSNNPDNAESSTSPSSNHEISTPTGTPKQMTNAEHEYGSVGINEETSQSNSFEDSNNDLCSDLATLESMVWDSKWYTNSEEPKEVVAAPDSNNNSNSCNSNSQYGANQDLDHYRNQTITTNSHHNGIMSYTCYPCGPAQTLSQDHAHVPAPHPSQIQYREAYHPNSDMYQENHKLQQQCLKSTMLYPEIHQRPIHKDVQSAYYMEKDGCGGDLTSQSDAASSMNRKKRKKRNQKSFSEEKIEQKSPPSNSNTGSNNHSTIRQLLSMWPEIPRDLQNHPGVPSQYYYNNIAHPGATSHHPTTHHQGHLTSTDLALVHHQVAPPPSYHPSYCPPEYGITQEALLYQRNQAESYYASQVAPPASVGLTPPKDIGSIVKHENYLQNLQNYYHYYNTPIISDESVQRVPDTPMHPFKSPPYVESSLKYCSSAPINIHHHQRLSYVTQQQQGSFQKGWSH